jgi:hypothetical protein
MKNIYHTDRDMGFQNPIALQELEIILMNEIKELHVTLKKKQKYLSFVQDKIDKKKYTQ